MTAQEVDLSDNGGYGIKAVDASRIDLSHANVRNNGEGTVYSRSFGTVFEGNNLSLSSGLDVAAHPPHAYTCGAWNSRIKRDNQTAFDLASGCEVTFVEGDPLHLVYDMFISANGFVVNDVGGFKKISLMAAFVNSFSGFYRVSTL